MPSLWKRITFSVASVLCVGSVALLVVALATEKWVTGRILCKTGAEIVNASHPEMDQFIGDIYYGLFQGGKTKKCGLGNRRSKIYIFPNLVKTLNGGLHMMVILFLLVAVAFALVSLSFCIYNARRVPYQSIKGHKGLYLWNFIAGKSSGFSDAKLYSSFFIFLCLALKYLATDRPFPHISSFFWCPGCSVFPGCREASQSDRAGGKLQRKPFCP
uniref:Clarin 2 n=1 Tax=Oryzias melastigma TaxID=30732 RepID=A0A3B3CYE4_ORYME